MTSWELTRHADQVRMAQLPAHSTVPRWALAESTFDTDWILVPGAQSDQAAQVWSSAGHLIDLEEPA